MTQHPDHASVREAPRLGTVARLYIQSGYRRASTKPGPGEALTFRDDAQHIINSLFNAVQANQKTIADLAARIEQLVSATPAVQPAAQGRVYLVATGELYEGEETYTRYDGAPPPLCDAECLYTSPQPPAATQEGAPGREVDADAARYRWLRDGNSDVTGLIIEPGRFSELLAGSELDSAIDKAMAASNAQGAAAPTAPAATVEDERARYEAQFPKPEALKWTGAEYELVDRDCVNSYFVDRWVGGWRAWLARAALSTAAVKAAEVPDGYALVPIEPTVDMLIAGQEAWMMARHRCEPFEDCREAEHSYKAMLAAAPAQGKEGV